MTVSEYAVCFSDLARHAPALVSTVRERVCWFIEGLILSIRASMDRELEMDISYQQVMSIARRVEGMLARDRKERGDKRGYVSRPIHSAFLAASDISALRRPRELYYASPVSSVPSARGVING
uniref:Uncharacterized protein LOC104210988 n=1 Tax=Nicotiana sylvestris TaxID=4096 RepID=A0A1U7UZV8_NICSY|nr:PREDICTED: uncharacterized protein LOC104210988 [Nicotiana sylvestris]